MSDEIRQRLMALQAERTEQLAAQAAGAEALVSAEQAVRAADQLVAQAPDLLAAGRARADQLAARQGVLMCQQRIAMAAARLALVVEEIEALREMLDEAGRIPPGASDPPWRLGPGSAGRVGIYAAAGAFVAEVQNEIDARLIISLVNRAARAVLVDTAAGKPAIEGGS